MRSTKDLLKNAKTAARHGKQHVPTSAWYHIITILLAGGSPASSWRTYERTTSLGSESLHILPGFRSWGIWLEPEPSLWPGFGSTLNICLIIHVNYMELNLIWFLFQSKHKLWPICTDTCNRTYFRQFVVSFKKNSKIMFSFTRNRSRLRVENSMSQSLPITGRLRNPASYTTTRDSRI